MCCLHALPAAPVASLPAHLHAAPTPPTQVVRRLPPEASAVKAVGQALYYFDSGALSALLKELNKSGHVRRAQEVSGLLCCWGVGPSSGLHSGVAASAAWFTGEGHWMLVGICNPRDAVGKAHPPVAARSARPPIWLPLLAWLCFSATEQRLIAAICKPVQFPVHTLVEAQG